MRTWNASLLLMCLTLVGVFSIESRAALPPTTKNSPKPTKILSGQGMVTGGQAGTGFSLKAVEWSKLAGKERLILDVADLNGAPIRGFPGYYHVELQQKPRRRLVIDFAQTPNTFLDEKDILKKVKGSAAISGASFVLDPTDQTLSLILDLKKDVKAQVFQVAGKKNTSRVVVDLQ